MRTFTETIRRDGVRSYDGRQPVDLPNPGRYLPAEVVDALGALEAARQDLADHRKTPDASRTPDWHDRDRELDQAARDARDGVYAVWKANRTQVHANATQGRQRAVERLRELRAELEAAALDYTAWAALEGAQRPACGNSSALPGHRHLAEALNPRGQGLAGALAEIDLAEEGERAA